MNEYILNIDHTTSTITGLSWKSFKHFLYSPIYMYACVCVNLSKILLFQILHSQNCRHNFFFFKRYRINTFAERFLVYQRQKPFQTFSYRIESRVDCEWGQNLAPTRIKQVVNPSSIPHYPPMQRWDHSVSLKRHLFFHEKSLAYKTQTPTRNAIHFH